MAKLIEYAMSLLPSSAKGALKFSISFLLGSTFMLAALVGEEHIETATQFLNWILSLM